MTARRTIPSGPDFWVLTTEAERALALHISSRALALHFRGNPNPNAITRRWSREHAEQARGHWARFVRLRKLEGRA